MVSDFNMMAFQCNLACADPVAIHGAGYKFNYIGVHIHLIRGVKFPHAID